MAEKINHMRGKNHMKKLKNEIVFQIPKKFSCNTYQYKNLKITIEKIKSLKKLILNRKKIRFWNIRWWFS